MLYRSLLFCFLLIAAAAPALAVGDDAPDWLQQAAAAKPPAYDKDVPAVVLHQEQVVKLDSDGRLTTTTTYAVRILTREGRAYAEAVETYLTNAGKVKEIRAWLIRPNGEVKKYGKDQVIDRMCNPLDIYDECRAKLIDATLDADAGMIFGYQSSSEEQPLFSQERWVFQSRLPTLVSRYTLSLPSNWQASSITFNHPNVAPVVSGSTYTWELRNLPPIVPESASPVVTNLAPRLAVKYSPAEGSSAQARTRSFDNWVEVSRWATELHDPQAVPNEAIIAKTLQLTAGAKTELDKIRAVGRFVQELQYISIDVGVGRGNGFRPHSAAQAFAKLYGDCKDKANLMRTMLKTINITAYPVVIFSGDRTFVREEWASPTQFNHVIIAVKVSDETQAATVITHPKLGRLLIFDATDDNTPVGDLPDHEQGSLALLVAGDDGALMRMPITSPEANLLDRQSEVMMDADGAITVTVSDRAVGQKAADFRRVFRSLSRPEYTGMIETWVARGANGAKVSKVNPTDSHTEGRFVLDIEFTARNYAQLMQDKLLVFRPAIFGQMRTLSLTEAKRNHPIVLEAEAYKDTVRIKLPAGFVVDEMPDAMKLETSFGTFSATYEVKDGYLVFTRNLIQRTATIPVEDYAKVKNFYAGMRVAEQAPVVLVKK
ncbi:MAG: DUF3857 domain-containing protein [Pyrinomonadaceae bacterium]|nr:DUF3857 domain-containing protein [Pyrinomonadaceae bacterium]